MKDLRVAIAGAGLGGLCLAQGLAGVGIHAEVFERDPSPHSRGQGYRLRIDGTGQQALASCLSAPRYSAFLDSCAVPGDGGRFVNQYGGSLNERRPDSWQPDADLAVDRQSLRELLCQGIAEKLHFGQAVHDFAEGDDGVELILADGGRRRFDMLVAADGVSSVLRTRRVPQARVDDIGAINIYGKTPLAADIKAQLASELLAGVTVVFADGLSLVIEPMRFRRPSAKSVDAESRPWIPADDYLYWAFIGRSDCFGGLGGKDVLERIVSLTRDWHPQFHPIFVHADRNSISERPVLMARSVPDWPVGRVTLLGDAIHAMSPAGGLGANTALGDAARLSQALARAGRNSNPLNEIGCYEQEMRTRAVAALEMSLAGTERLLRRFA